MDATLSANRKIVVINSTVGKIAKSSGLRTENTAISTITDKAMLKVNSTSSTSGGSGSTTIESIARIAAGIATPCARTARSGLGCGRLVEAVAI